MSVRQAINEHPGVVAAAVGVVVLLAVGVLWLGSSPSRGGQSAGGKAFYSVDDGKSWFAAPETNLAPFDHEGKAAVRLYMYQCGTGEPFVGFLERYTPDARKTLMDMRSAGPNARPTAAVFGLVSNRWAGREIKRPGDKEWRPASDLKVRDEVVPSACPNKADALLGVAP